VPSPFEDRIQDSNTAQDSQTNALATATVALIAGRSHVFLKVEASYSASTTSALLQIKFGTTVKFEKYIHGAGAIDAGVLGMINPVQGEAISAELAAGGAGVVGKVCLSYYTR